MMMMVMMMVMMIVMMMVMVSTWQKSQEGEDWDVTSPSGVIAPTVRHQPGQELITNTLTKTSNKTDSEE